MIGFALLGAGVIGNIHAHNIALHPDYKLIHVIDPISERANELSERFGGYPGADINRALEDDGVDIVIIASSTLVHADQVIACAKARKDFLCEKPIANSLEETIACTREVEESGVVALMGFNRRLDQDYRSMFDRVREGKIGKVEMIRITSRTFNFKSPEPETVHFSGGMMREKGTHFFDLATWISGAEPIEVYAAGSCLIDKNYEKFGEVDTASIIIRLDNDALVSLEFNRRAIYGQDEWMEVAGSEGMLQCGRKKTGSMLQYTKSGILMDRINSQWYEQFKPTYALQLDQLVAASLKQGKVHATLIDGLKAQAVAEAAIQSISEKQPIIIQKVW